MFEHFTFGAQAQTSFTPIEDTFPSPTDCSFILEVDTSSCTYAPEESEPKEEMHDIVAQLSSHSLHPSDDELPQPSSWNTLPSPDFSNEMTDFTPEELTFTSSSRGKVTISNSLPNLPISHPKHGTVANRRLQRQLNTQLQSCNTHIKDISSLVSNMISTSTQCTLHHPPLTTVPFHTEPLELDLDDEPVPSLQQETLHEDEGFAEMEDEDTEMTLRRASTPSGIRKWNVRFRANGECVNGPPEAAWMGRRKVRCVPRMRRRKPKVDSVGE